MRTIKRRFFLLLLASCLTTAVYGQTGPLDVEVWSEDFQGFDPCRADPPFSGDLFIQDPTWSNNGANYAVIADERFIREFINVYSGEDPQDPFVPDPCNYVLAVAKTGVQWHEIGWAVKDFAPIANSVGQFGEYLRLDFDAFRTHDPDVWWSDTLSVLVRTAVESNIVSLELTNVRDGTEMRLNGVGIPGSAWQALSWNHYGLFMNFSSDYVALYINDEPTPRLIVPFTQDYEVSDISEIWFGSGIYYRAGRTHSQFYDNILLTANWVCPAGDLTGDCAVGLADLAILASTWLEGPYIAGPYVTP